MAVYQQKLFSYSKWTWSVASKLYPSQTLGWELFWWGCVKQHLEQRWQIKVQSLPNSNWGNHEFIGITSRSVGDSKVAAAPKVLTPAWIITTPQLQWLNPPLHSPLNNLYTPVPPVTMEPCVIRKNSVQLSRSFSKELIEFQVRVQKTFLNNQQAQPQDSLPSSYSCTDGDIAIVLGAGVSVTTTPVI